ncbi:hypothetical protein B0H13DRAFT_1935754 [Mycena leptocephala]|nr:hypothetical protein B0H13DRAFT_1935754 [Mycena leptocephala]
MTQIYLLFAPVRSSAEPFYHLPRRASSSRSNSARTVARMRRKYTTLSNVPRLCGHVRKLLISEGSPGDQPSWCQSTVAVVGLLNAVTSVELVFQSLTQWSNWPTELRTAIRALCQRSPLVSLRLSGLTITNLTEFSQLVASLTLKELWLRDINFPSPTEGELAPMNKHIRLTNCRFDVNGPALNVFTRWLVKGETLSDLQLLQMLWNVETSPYLQEIAQASMCSLSLLLLHSHDVRVSHDFSNTLSLSALEKLRALDISLFVKLEDTDRLAHLLAGLLETCPRSLTTLQFDIHLVSDPIIDWAPLARILTTTHFPLAYVGFSVSWISRLSAANSPQAQTFIEGIQRGFPHLSALGILDCSVL